MESNSTFSEIKINSTDDLKNAFQMIEAVQSDSTRTIYTTIFLLITLAFIIRKYCIK